MSTIAIIGPDSAGSFLPWSIEAAFCHLDDRILLIGKNAQLGAASPFRPAIPIICGMFLAGNKSVIRSAGAISSTGWLASLKRRKPVGPDIGPASPVPRCFCGSYTQSVVGDRLWRARAAWEFLVATDEAVRLTCEGGESY